MEMHVHKQPLNNNCMVKRIEHSSLAHFPTRNDKEEVQLQGKELFKSQFVEIIGYLVVPLRYVSP